MSIQLKKAILIATTALACNLIAAAHSVELGNVTVYGKARLSADSTDDGAKHVTRVSESDSRLGFKGKEDLGNGLKAIFQIETSVSLDAGASSSGSLFGAGRNSYVGLESGIGSAVLGIHNSPYRDATGKLDPFEESMADYNSIIGNISGNGTTSEYNRREPNTVNYWSPQWNGLQFKAQYRFDENAATEEDRYSVSGTYENGPLFASVSHETHQGEGGGGAHDTHGNKLGLGYTVGEATKLGFVYENLSEQGAASAFDRNAWYVSLAHKIGSNTLKAAYGRAGDHDAADDSGADLFAVGATHHLSKRTEVFGLYAVTRNDNQAAYHLGSGTNGVTAPSAPGQDVSSFSVGINHNF